MSVIGIIDDRQDIRITLRRKIDVVIKKLGLPWITLDIDPLPQKADYISWITENGISVLLLDEKLQEGGRGANVDYNGSELIELLRKSLPDFPVFAITNYPKDPDLQARFPLFDGILGRDEFFRKAEEFITRFTRAGQRFSDSFTTQLTKISDLSKKMALGTATDEDVKELKALQEFLNISFGSLQFQDREEWLKTYEEKLVELNAISEQIKNFIDTYKK